MPDWILIAAPLLIAAIVLTFAFVGCEFKVAPPGEGYADVVEGNPRVVSYWRLEDAQGTPAWSADTQESPSPYVNAAETGNTTASTTQTINLSDPSIPSGTPMALFQTERWDGSSAPEMQWRFPVAAGSYEVRLAFAETYSGAQSVGARVFDVSIEGTTVLDNYDIFGDVGGYKGIVKSFIVSSDASLDITFGHVVQNPAIKGIEIISTGGPNQLAYRVNAGGPQLQGPAAVDSTGKNPGGMYKGGVTLGVRGLLWELDAAAQFDGHSGYVSVPHDTSLNPPKLTVEALVTIAGGDGTLRAIVSSRDVDAGNQFGYSLYVSDENRWEAWIGDGTSTGLRVQVGKVDAVKVGAGQPLGPYYVAMTYDGNKVVLCVNMVDINDPDQVAQRTVSLNLQPNMKNELRIGAGANEQQTPQYFFNGVIDEVAIYEDALTFDTLLSHFAVAATGQGIVVTGHG
jgi:Malectin domain/Concanavalin A-like lectin/glucanases superfamily